MLLSTCNIHCLQTYWTTPKLECVQSFTYIPTRVFKILGAYTSLFHSNGCLLVVYEHVMKFEVMSSILGYTYERYPVICAEM